ncbi:MAG: rhodanese-like domain-containing protein [Candidatus Moranbacteria bacterium]|nr:rhodanese-like domain-containing protein [Candidatus Moranbacteria bacterium]
MDQNRSNSKALIIGVFLIFVVVSITVIRSLKTKSNPVETPSTAEDQNTAIKKDKLMEAGELSRRIINKEDITIIDVRSNDEFAAEHIIGSRNIPLSQLGAGLAGLNKSKTYVLVDSSEDTDPQLINELLPAQGFNNIFYLAGGFAGWKTSFQPTISAGDPNSFADQAKVTYIKSDPLKELMASDQNLAIIDVRRPATFADGHLKGATNIFLDEIEQRKSEVPLGKKIVVYDNDGLWAFQAAVRLSDLGFFNVQSLADGFDVWKQKGFEIVK